MWELRRFGRRFNDKQLRIGRTVELRRGYSTPDSIWGEIANVIIADNITEFFKKVPFKEVIPVAESLGSALEIAHRILGSENQKVIGFRVAKNAASDSLGS